jgi:hypothetical protein
MRGIHAIFPSTEKPVSSKLGHGTSFNECQPSFIKVNVELDNQQSARQKQMIRK